MNLNGARLCFCPCARLAAHLTFGRFSLQTYIKSMDKDFVAATIQAIGRCATNIGEVRDTCLNGLVQLLSNRDGESFCVLLQQWLSAGGDSASVFIFFT